MPSQQLIRVHRVSVYTFLCALQGTGGGGLGLWAFLSCLCFWFSGGGTGAIPKKGIGVLRSRGQDIKTAPLDRPKVQRSRPEVANQMLLLLLPDLKTKRMEQKRGMVPPFTCSLPSLSSSSSFHFLVLKRKCGEETSILPLLLHSFPNPG